MDRSFCERFKEHEKEWLHEENDVLIRLGRLWKEDYKHDPPEWTDWRLLLPDVEALLIYWHSPPYNSRHITEYKGQPLYLQNWGNRGSIIPECSTDWQFPRPRDEGN